MLVVVNGASNETGRPLAIYLELTSGMLLPTNFTFEYRADPVYTNINPRQHLTVLVATLVRNSQRSNWSAPVLKN